MYRTSRVFLCVPFPCCVCLVDARCCQVGSSVKISVLSAEDARGRCKKLSLVKKKLERQAVGAGKKLERAEGRASRAELENMTLRARVAAQDREFESLAGVPREGVALLAAAAAANVKFKKAGAHPLPYPLNPEPLTFWSVPFFHSAWKRGAGGFRIPSSASLWSTDYSQVALKAKH